MKNQESRMRKNSKKSFDKWPGKCEKSTEQSSPQSAVPRSGDFPSVDPIGILTVVILPDFCLCMSLRRHCFVLLISVLVDRSVVSPMCVFCRINPYAKCSPR
jgi:hypothetical protein